MCIVHINIKKGEGTMHRGEIWLTKLPKRENSRIQGKVRPCIIVTNNLANYYSPVIHVTPLSTTTKKLSQPTHIPVKKEKTGLLWDSTALIEQTVLVDKEDILNFVGYCDEETMKKVDTAVGIQFGLITIPKKLQLA